MNYSKRVDFPHYCEYYNGEHIEPGTPEFYFCNCWCWSENEDYYDPKNILEE